VSRGTIFLLGGINDVWVVGRAWKRWLPAAGLPHRLEVIRWQQGFWAALTFADLWRTDHHRQVAANLAARIREAQAAHPGEHIHILAHSAGTAITAYAFEQLTPAEAITSAAFVGSGLSPGYDLSAALHRTRFGILTVESRLDAFFLGVGTCLLGTADRYWGPAAGMVGFRTPSDPTVAGKLHRTQWEPRFVRQGWLGGHISIASPWFIRGTLAAWVRQAEASVEVGAGSGLRANTHSSTG
jgi:alpha-beta hydrolase superfamily lysophospholipase